MRGNSGARALRTLTLEPKQLLAWSEILTIAFPMRPWARADGMSGQIFALRRECQIICGALNGEQGPLLSDFVVRRFPPWYNQTAIHTGNSSLVGL
jgi:hypothetical protein